jgi:hypothetical protein
MPPFADQLGTMVRRVMDAREGLDDRQPPGPRQQLIKGVKTLDNA